MEKAIEKGFLRAKRNGVSSGNWAVSTESLSDFLATRACEAAQKQAARHRPGTEHRKFTAKTKVADNAVPPTENRSRETRFLELNQPELRATVFDTSREMILAVLMRRSVEMRSSRFKVAVVALQISLVFTVILASLWALEPLWAARPVEQKAVLAWLDKEYPEGYRLTEWGNLKNSADSEAIQFRVKFTYKRSTSRGWVRTDRIFTLVENQVASVDTDDE